MQAQNEAMKAIVHRRRTIVKGANLNDSPMFSNASYAPVTIERETKPQRPQEKFRKCVENFRDCTAGGHCSGRVSAKSTSTLMCSQPSKSLVQPSTRKGASNVHARRVIYFWRRHTVVNRRSSVPESVESEQFIRIRTAAARGAPRHDQRIVVWGSTFESDSLANQSTPRSTYTRAFHKLT